MGGKQRLSFNITYSINLVRYPVLTPTERGRLRLLKSFDRVVGVDLKFLFAVIARQQAEIRSLEAQLGKTVDVSVACADSAPVG
jgi:hypothetical protein